MIYLACFIIAFSLIQLLVAVSNLLFNVKLEQANCNFDGLVSVLIPARNEEKNIGKLLGDLQKQDYATIEIVVLTTNRLTKLRIL